MDPTLIIEVSGGCVQAVYCEDAIRVIVADWDHHKSGGNLCHELNAVFALIQAPGKILQDKLILKP